MCTIQAPSATSNVVVPGTFVWLEDEQEAWIEGEVIAVEKKKITVRANGKEVRGKRDGTNKRLWKTSGRISGRQQRLKFGASSTCV